MKKYEASREKLVFWVLTPVRIFKMVCFFTGLVVLLLAGGFGVYARSFYKSLPDVAHMDFKTIRAFAEKSVAMKLEDKTHVHQWVELNDVSRDCIYALVVSEDSGFFDHSGLEYDAILNALAENIKKKKYEFGASTISQQVVKNVFLTNERTLVRKAKELVLTEQLEATLSKNQILEVYLNIAEFGRDLFGIQEAATLYFKKPASQINAAEAAFIALMLPSPRKNQYALYENKNLPDTKRRKIRRILGDMYATELISAQQYQQYTKYNYFHGQRATAAVVVPADED